MQRNIFLNKAESAFFLISFSYSHLFIMKTKCYLFCLLTLGLVACKNLEGPDNHSDFTKLCDYLYEITYSDLDDSMYETIEEFTTEVFGGCSSVRRGNFHGRNLDLFYSEFAEVVVRVQKSENRFASVGVCGGLLFTPELIENYMIGDVYQMIPFVTMDGINENGVVCNVNVVPADVPESPGTHPGKPRLYMGIACRYILDNARSAHHAVELLEERDLFGDGFGGMYQFHLMISDKDSTMIVELINNQLVCHAESAVSDKNIMTNYFCTLDTLTSHAQGLERAQLLKEHYDEATSDREMMNLMKRVKYTNAYKSSTTPFWYSEFVGVYEDGSDVTIHSDSSTLKEVSTTWIDRFDESYPDDRESMEIWQTIHTSVYSISERKLLLAVQENYDRQFEFTLR